MSMTMKIIQAILLLAITLPTVMAASSCPCRYDPERECTQLVESSVLGECKEVLVPCPCHCVDDGTEQAVCEMIPGFTNVYTIEPQCQAQQVQVPSCSTDGTPPVETTYVCVDAVQLNGLGTLECTIPPLPCETIVSAELNFYQFSNYTTLVSFGTGTAIFTINVKVFNAAIPDTWFATTLPGSGVNVPFDTFPGPGTVFREYSDNSSDLTAPATTVYIQKLIENCQTRPTTFFVAVSYDIDNSGATFNDQSPFGLTTITGMSIIVTSQV